MPKSTRNHHVTAAENLRSYHKKLKAKGGYMFTMLMQPEDVEALKLVWLDLSVGTRAEAIRGALQFYIEKKQLK